MPIPNQVTLSGNVYIKYVDIDQIEKATLGDIMLFLNSDTSTHIATDYFSTNLNGYFKAKLFDGRVWQYIDIVEFCTFAENKFAKRQKPIDTAHLCKSIIEKFKGTTLYKTYRGHFTINEYIPELVNRRHLKWNKIKIKH